MSKQMQTSHGDAEVFVLPPNLLEKLGINLYNITENAHQLHEPKKRKKNKHSLNNGSYSNHEGIIKSVSESLKKNKESSILETADLMKKSVFLSPTFIHMVGNAIPGGVELVNNVKSSKDINSSEINEEINTDDNNRNKDLDEENVPLDKLSRTALNYKQQGVSAETNPSLICNGTSNGLVFKSKRKENEFSNGIQSNHFDPNVNSGNENYIKDNKQGLSNSLVLKNVQVTPSHQDNSQTSKILCDSDNTNYEISTKDVHDLSLSINCNAAYNNSNTVVIDAIVLNKKCFIKGNSTLDIDEALIIPLSLTPEPTSDINLNDINGNAEDINIDIFQTLNEQVNGDLEITNRKQNQQHEICKPKEFVDTNDVNIDIIKYTECDDCSDMELENILHETEILIPDAVHTQALKSNHPIKPSSINEVIDVIDKEGNHSISQQTGSNENDLCDSIEENKILICMLPELMDSSSLDIICENNINNDFDTSNKNQKLMIPITYDTISITSESLEQIQSSEINTDKTTYIDCHDTSNKCDVGLDSVLREPEILIPLGLPSESINNNNINMNKILERQMRPSFTENEVLIETEIEKKLKEDEVRILVSTKSPYFEKKDIPNQILVNIAVVNSNTNIQKDDSFENNSSSKIIKVNNQNAQANRKDLLHKVNQITQSSLQDNIVFSLSKPLCMNVNNISTRGDEQQNCIIGNKINNVTEIFQNIQKYHNNDFVTEVRNNNLCFDSEVDREHEVNKSHKSEFDKSDKESLNKLIEIDRNSATCDGSQSNHEVNIVEDKVQEIAEYLKQVIQNNSKRRHNNKRGVKLLKPKPGTKSKMFVQGVEKPGGSEEYELTFDKIKIHKTYERKKKHVKPNPIPVTEAELLKNVSRPEENYTEMNTCIQTSCSPKRQEYCLCGDFGKLAYFEDNDSLYEHIHFGSYKGANCSVETVFGIYNEERSIVNSTEDIEYTLQKYDCSDYEDCHICWQKFEYQNNDKSVRPEMQTVIKYECIEHTNLDKGISSSISNSALERANFSDSYTDKTQLEDNNDKTVSSEMSDTSLMEVIVEVDCEITPSLSPNPNTLASIIHTDSEENESTKQELSCETIVETDEAETDKSPQIDVESKEEEDDTQQPCEAIHDTVEFEAAGVSHIDDKQCEEHTKSQSCETENKSAEVATCTASHIEIESQEKEENIHQRSCEAVDESIEIAYETSQDKENKTSTTDCVENVKRIRNHVNSRKRKLNNQREEPPTKKSEKCGVCQQVFAFSEWDDHISTAHCYIAWKDGQNIDFDNLLLLKKLKKKLSSDGTLVCSICAFTNDHLEKFLSHAKKCVTREISKSKIDNMKEPNEVAATSKLERSKCGVCHEEVDDENWKEHISREHHYLAWKEGEPRLDTSDENEVKTHLLNLVKIYGQLICTKCGLLRKYTPKSIKSYLTHINKCRNDNVNESRLSIGNTESSTTESQSPLDSTFKCGVCGEKVEPSKWLDHIAQEHNYCAWKEGDKIPNLEDKAVLWEHLNEISKHAGGLQCSKCGIVRRYVKSFLQHTSHCTGNDQVDVSNSDLTKEGNELNSVESPKPSTETDAPICSSTPKTSKKKAKTLENQKTLCGVCNEAVEVSEWIDHIGKEHNYLAWKDGETPLDLNNKEEVWQHLHNIVSVAGKLVCAKCGKIRKYPKMYLQHISDCKGPVTSLVDDSTNESLNYSVTSYIERSLTGQNLNASSKEVKCGVCQDMVGRDAWIAHIQTAHGYVAWIDGETPLDSNNAEMIRNHLQHIVDEIGSLVCSKCGTSRKYAKKFLEHMKYCTTETQQKKGKHKAGSSVSSQNTSQHEFLVCGACKQTIRINQWMKHIRATHNYLAWRQGQVPVNKPTQALKRLQTLIVKLRELTCPKCGYKCNDAALYLQHSETCKDNLNNEIEDDEVTKLAREGWYQCALCLEKIKYGEWRDHSLSRHYTMAWVLGEEPIDIFNQNEIARIMKEYQQHSEFVCKVCGISRSSGLGFFAHVISCGLKDEEADRYKLTCEICNSKYPGFYQSQHMAAHSQQEMAKQRRKNAEEDREKEKQRKLEELTSTSGRRRAAEKARLVIEESVSQAKHVCQSCAFATDVEEELARHKCTKKRRMSDELDMSLEQDESSDEEALPDLEDEEDEEGEDSKAEPRKRPDNSCSSKITRIPFVIPNVQDYVAKNITDYTENYLTTATLFPEWATCRCEVVLREEISQFMPPLEESCQVYSSGNWRSYKRWEAVVERQKSILFTGASIQRICWLPALANLEEQAGPNVLAVACHNGVDCPRYDVEDLPQHNALIQLWDFGDFKTEPKLVFGLALQYGTVWALDWCPSGAREPPPNDSNKGFVRMGLLAVACSNGMAYIFSVPYPSSVVKSDLVIHKLEPVAQLKFTTKSDRKLYQATSVCWSQQKGHGTIIVGYADGSSAYYDLNTESPFLKSLEKNVTIYYPFYDEHTHDGSVTDMDSFPMGRSSSVTGAVCVASPTGSVLTSHGGSLRCGRMRTHLAAATATFLPAWPSALLAGEDIVINLTPAELEYWGLGRRAGFVQTCCGCAHCALVAMHMAPFLRVMRPHPARSDLKKQVVAWLGIKQLAKKRKHNEDKAAVKLEETLTYEEAITKYGIQFRMIEKANNSDDYKKAVTQYKEVNPECFPLAVVPSMAFCPSAKYHKRLAVATHAGLIFVINV